MLFILFAAPARSHGPEKQCHQSCVKMTHAKQDLQHEVPSEREVEVQERLILTQQAMDPAPGVALMAVEDLTQLWQVLVAVECVLADSDLKKTQTVKARHPKR